MAESHESISFPKGAVKELLNTAIIKGVVVSVDYANDKADITTNAYGLQSGVPIFYHCPNAHTVTGGSTAFGENDEVTVLCENAAGVTGTPTMSIIGFWNQKPKICSKGGFVYVHYSDKAIVWDLEKDNYATHVTDNNGETITSWPCDVSDLTTWLDTQDKVYTPVFKVNREYGYSDRCVYPPEAPGAINEYESAAAIDVPGLPLNYTKYLSDHDNPFSGTTPPQSRCICSGTTEGDPVPTAGTYTPNGHLKHYECDIQAAYKGDSFQVIDKNGAGEPRVFLDHYTYSFLEDDRGDNLIFYCSPCGPPSSYESLDQIIRSLDYHFNRQKNYEANTPLGVITTAGSDVRYGSGKESLDTSNDGCANASGGGPPPGCTSNCSCGSGIYFHQCGEATNLYAFFDIGQTVISEGFNELRQVYSYQEYTCDTNNCGTSGLFSWAYVGRQVYREYDEESTYLYPDSSDVPPLRKGVEWRNGQSDIAAFQIYFVEKKHQVITETRQYYGGYYKRDSYEETTEFYLDCLAGGTVFANKGDEYDSYNENRSTAFENALKDLYQAQRVAQNIPSDNFMLGSLDAVLVQDKSQ